ncbi:hypothetical protein PR202_gb14005 [Eleusine coracana subsp. coracana]|uniref:TLDc domain-containing protein n=1 Tax=Eleusine coracana subsp. coracana TaxID=191504 RepID=A0AAV5ETE6_ELECO|nr:hypothetical protein PR202_gb14005 [Eleusine coracana subsp. coracana]
MSVGKATELLDEDETKVFRGSGADKKLSALRKSLKRAKKYVEALHSHLEDLVPLVSAASGSAAGDIHGSGEESSQRHAKEMRRAGLDLEEHLQELLASSEKHQRALPSAAEEDLNDPSYDSSSPELPVPHPPFPKGGTTMDVLNWNAQCEKIDAADKVLDENLPTLRAPKDCRTTKAVQDWRSKKKVLAAARSVVNITPISEDGSTKMQFSGFILDRTSNHKSSFQFSVGLPDRKTIEAKLFHFSDHYDIAFLLLPMETSLDIPCFGCCPDYSQEVFVLGRDKDASLRVRRGVISWTEESDFIGCSHYMFLDGEVPQGGTGGPVIDHDGNFRGMAFQLEVCDLMKGRRRLITVPVGFCSAPESTSDNEV